MFQLVLSLCPSASSLCLYLVLSFILKSCGTQVKTLASAATHWTFWLPTAILHCIIYVSAAINNIVPVFIIGHTYIGINNDCIKQRSEPVNYALAYIAKGITKGTSKLHAYHEKMSK